MLKISSVFRVILVLCTMIMLRYLLLIPGADQLSDWGQRFVIVCAGLVLMVCSFLAEKKENRIYYRWLGQYIKPYFFVLIFSMLYTWFLYGYSVKNLLIAAIPFSYVVFAYPLIYIFCCDKNCFSFLKTVTFLQVAILVLKTIGWYTYNYSGIHFFEALTLEFEDWTRNGLQRVEWGQLYGVALIVATYFGFKGKVRLRNVLILTGMIWFLIGVSNTRFTSAVAVVSVGVMLYFMYRKGPAKWGMRLILIAAVLVVFVSGFLSQLFYDASHSGKYAGSTTAREENVQHYFGTMKENRSICGLGLLVSQDLEAHRLLYRNEWSDYYLDDIGLLGGVVRFGILSIIVYGWLFWLMIKTCWNCLKKHEYDYIPLLVGLACYVIGTCLLQNIYDWQRAFGVPFYLAIFSYIDGQIELKNEIKMKRE